MQSKEQVYHVTVKKIRYVTYKVYANSFDDVLASWEEYGEEVDVDPLDDILLSVVANEAP